jgi:hypothetical protein
LKAVSHPSLPITIRNQLIEDNIITDTTDTNTDTDNEDNTFIVLIEGTPYPYGHLEIRKKDISVRSDQNSTTLDHFEIDKRRDEECEIRHYKIKDKYVENELNTILELTKKHKLPNQYDWADHNCAHIIKELLDSANQLAKIREKKLKITPSPNNSVKHEVLDNQKKIILKQLWSNYKEITPLIMAAKHGTISLINFLLNENPDQSELNIALMSAQGRNDEEVIRALYDKGAKYKEKEVIELSIPFRHWVINPPETQKLYTYYDDYSQKENHEKIREA